MAGQTLRLLVSAADASEGVQYEDDGHTLAHQRGTFLRRRFTARAEGGRWTLQAAAPEGPYRPAARDLEVEVRGLVEPQSVTVGGEALARVRGGPGRLVHAGWRRTDEGALLVRTRDRFEPFSITVSR